MLLTSMMVGILTVFVFFAFNVGLKALFKSQAQNELLGQLQVAAKRLTGALGQAPATSVSYDVGNRAISFLTFYDQNGEPQYHSDGSPEWVAYLIFYHDNANNLLLRKRLELRNSVSQRRTPTPIEQYNPGGGREPLAFYLPAGVSVSRLSEGAQMARLIEDFQIVFRPELGTGFEFVLSGLRPREGNRAESRSSIRWNCVARN